MPNLRALRWWLCSIFAISLCCGQIQKLGCPECGLSKQRPDARWSDAIVTFLKDPKPFDIASIISGASTESASPDIGFVARVVSLRPLTLDTLRIEMKHLVRDDSENVCSTRVIPLVDEKLKPALSKLEFGEVVSATITIGGNRDFPHEFYLSRIAPSRVPDEGSGSCFNRSGLLLYYGTLVDHVRVFNDGSISYQDSALNRFETQKLSPEELAELLKEFAAEGFDSLPSAPPTLKVKPAEVSLTLLCARLQTVSLAGMEGRVAPLRVRLEALKTRATSQTYYLLMFKDKVKLTLAPWPIPEVSLQALERQERELGIPGHAGLISDASMKTVPADFLSAIPRQANASGEPVYYTEGNDMYRVLRNCHTRPCDTFQDLSVVRTPHVEDLEARKRADPRSIGAQAESVGVVWPTETGVRLSDVGPQGLRISNSEYEKSKFLYSQLVDVGPSGGLFGRLLADGYGYSRVRICRVDPQAKPSHCTDPDRKTN